MKAVEYYRNRVTLGTDDVEHLRAFSSAYGAALVCRYAFAEAADGDSDLADMLVRDGAIATFANPENTTPTGPLPAAIVAVQSLALRHEAQLWFRFSPGMTALRSAAGERFTAPHELQQPNYYQFCLMPREVA